MELKQYLAVVKKWWWLMVAATLVAAISSYIAVSRVPRVYQATTTVIVGQGLQKPNPTSQDLWISQQLAQTYQNMVSRQPILEGAAQALGLSFVPLANTVWAQLVPGTQFLEIQVRDTDPARARALADEIARQLILQTPNELAEDQARRTFIRTQLENLEKSIQATEEEIEAEQAKLNAATGARAIQQRQTNVDALQKKLASHQATYASLLESVQGRTNYIALFEPAALPTKPISPRVPETILMAAATGLLLALGGVFLIEFMDDTVKTPDDVGRTVALPTLGTMPYLRNHDDDSRPISARLPLSPVVEAYRALRTNVQSFSVDKPIRTLLVTSPSRGEGKSTTAANLGVVLAQAGKSVVLVDSDLRRSVLHKIFQLPNKQGLSTLLFEDEPILDNWLQGTDGENLRVLTSGPLPLNPSELLGSQKMRHLVERLTEQVDMVIFDAPPALLVTDAAVLASQTDAVLIVARAGQTRRAAIRQAAENLRQVGAKVIGVTLNGISPREAGGYAYYYYAEDTRVHRRQHTRRWLEEIPLLGRLFSR